MILAEGTLEYWRDDGWFVGQLREHPAVVSQGATLDELIANIHDAYALLNEGGDAAG
jgi:predicted RNase H-like HicB family nuclease